MQLPTLLVLLSGLTAVLAAPAVWHATDSAHDVSGSDSGFGGFADRSPARQPTPAGAHRHPRLAQAPTSLGRTNKPASSPSGHEPLPSGDQLYTYCAAPQAQCDQCQVAGCQLNCPTRDQCRYSTCPEGVSPILLDPKYDNAVQAFKPVDYHRCHRGDRVFQFGLSRRRDAPRPFVPGANTM
ncbi:MAG: hypothetical protein M1826_000922 [Phylliscum demangeonii]|nr:MAG: hypothetical protein M1826_000922 [Phylliscum demangeonii]